MHDPADLDVIGALADPVRRSVYEHVVSEGRAVSRDEAAAAVGISRSLAAYHLDRLVTEGLLDADFERPPGRTGPGAGRPAKRYPRSAREVAVSFPARDYELVAELLAEAVERDSSGSARRALEGAAREMGAQDVAPGRAARTARAGRRRLLDALVERGYEPYAAGAEIHLRNCPFHRLADRHTELVCGMNLALTEGLVDAVGDTGLRPELDPCPGECCVVFRKS